MKKYHLVKKQFGGTKQIDKIYIETTNPDAFQRLKEELIATGFDENNIISKKAYLASDIPPILDLVNKIEEDGKKMYDGVFVHDKFSIEKGEEFIEYLDNSAKYFNNIEIAEFYNYMDVINHANKKKYKNIIYMSDNCKMNSFFSKNFNTLYDKVEKDCDIILLGVKNSKEKFDTIEEHICKPNKLFVEEGKQYWANNVYACLFRRNAIKVLAESLTKMDGQFWYEVAKKNINNELNIYYNCNNLINYKHETTNTSSGEIKDTHSPDASKEKYVSDASKEKYVSDAPKEKYSTEPLKEKYVSDNSINKYINRDVLRDSIRDGVKDGLSDMHTSVTSLASIIKDGFNSLQK